MLKPFRKIHNIINVFINLNVIKLQLKRVYKYNINNYFTNFLCYFTCRIR